MQTLQKLVSLESCRKSGLCRQILHSECDYLVDDIIPGSNLVRLLDLINETIAKWPDGCAESFVDVDFGKSSFLNLSTY